MEGIVIGVAATASMAGTSRRVATAIRPVAGPKVGRVTATTADGAGRQATAAAAPTGAIGRMAKAMHTRKPRATPCRGATIATVTAAGAASRTATAVRMAAGPRVGMTTATVAAGAGRLGMTASVRVPTPSAGVRSAATHPSRAFVMAMGADTSPAIVAAPRPPRSGQAATVAMTTRA